MRKKLTDGRIAGAKLTEDGRRAFSNGAWMYALQIVNTVLPFITLPYVARILGAEGYGFFSIALNVVGYYQVIVEYGFGMSATRKVAARKTGRNLLQSTFSSVFYSRIILASGCFIASILICFGFGWDNLVSQALLVMTVSVFGYSVQQNWLFQGMQDMRLISTVNIVGRTISTVLIFTMVRRTNDVLLYCFLYCLTPLVAGFAGLFLAMRKYQIKLAWPGVHAIWNEVKDGFYVFTTQLSSKVFSAIGVTFMTLFSTAYLIGAFSAIQKIAVVLMMAWTPISQVLYPISTQKLALSIKEGAVFIMKARQFSMAVFGILAIALGLSAHEVVSALFGEEYSNFYYWAFPLLGWVLVGINNNFMGIQLLLGSGHDREYSKCFQMGVVVTVLINIIAIMMFSADGAAVAPLLSELVLAVLLRRECKKVLKLG